ncbi:MAG: hypothetical protein IJK98_10770 [Clostridia bacterium]|nr:hypothetical protein [Clostridia bacterium]
MDERVFREPEPEDRELPEREPAGGDAEKSPDGREDHDLPGTAYIDHASAMFNFGGRPEEDRRTRVAPVPPAGRAGEETAAPEREPSARPPRYAPGAPAADEGSPTPPWLAKQPEAAAPFPSAEEPPAENPSGPAPPDPSLLPDPPGKDGNDRQTKRMKWIILGLCAVIVLLAGAVIVILKGGAGEEVLPGGTEEAFVMPRTASEIADFYKRAVNRVKEEGQAGYRRRSWQTISELNLTGITFVDGIISGAFDQYVVPPESAETETYTKGTEFAKARFPGFRLEDYSVIRSAECVASGSNCLVTLVFDDEDTPNEADSFLGKVTDAVFFWDTQIVPILSDISQLKAYSGVHVRYHDFTVTAELSQDGRFVSLKHTVPAEVDIGSARVGIFTFRDKYLHFESTAEYTDFVY